jgi:hypothetical protein
MSMMEYKIKTYEEALKVIEKIGLLPLAPLIPDFPSLNSITSKDDWYSESEFDPWIWRTRFSSDGVAGYGKFIKKKSILISHQLLPYMKKVLGYQESVEERYFSGNITKEAFNLYKIIREEEGIDTRALRSKADMKDKDQKKIFDNALVELQGTMDIVISGIQEKKNADGEKKGWSSTSFETYESWATRNHVETISLDREEAKNYLLVHFTNVCNSNESLKNLEKVLN